MSSIGKNPSVKWLTLEPQSVDPSSPNEGDVFRSDGTPRDEGLWVFEAGAWAQISTGATLSTLDNLTLTPQNAAAEAAPPLSTPTEGLTYRADGSGRTEGIWTYQSGGWAQVTGLRYQEFTHKPRFTVRVATITHAPLTSGNYQSGGTLDGVILAANDLILLKNQSTATENGVYTVNTGVAPTRSTSYDSAAELTHSQIYVSSGTNAGNIYWQGNVLTNIAVDAQSWSTNAPTFTFTAPEGVYDIEILMCGAGGAGGGGASHSAFNAAGGGGGGGGLVRRMRHTLSPSDTLTIAVGVGGKGGAGGIGVGNNGASGTSGGVSIVSDGASLSFVAPGGGYGGGGVQTGAGLAGGDTFGGNGGTALGSGQPGGGGGASEAAGGAGGNSSTAVGTVKEYSGSGGGARSNGASAAGARSFYNSTTAAAGAVAAFGASGGAGGGSSLGAGGVGGAAAAVSAASPGLDGSDYGGGGGGGGSRTSVGTYIGGNGGHGASGYVLISWS